MNKGRRHPIIIFLFVIFQPAFIKADNPPQPGSVTKNDLPPKEVYVSLPAQGAHLPNLSEYISISRVTPDSIYGFVRADTYKSLSLSGITLLPHPSAADVKMAADLSELRQWQSYPTLDQYHTLMQAFSDSFPNLCTRHIIGTSAEGRPIMAVRIQVPTPDSAACKPAVFLTSSMHGNEATGYILLLRLIDFLTTNYGTNDDITTLIDHLDLWISPLANPDGAYAGGENTLTGSTRFNANGVDLNRNFPDPEDGYHPDGKPWQPETQAMMNFMNEKKFCLSANLHTGAEVVNYPWDTWYRRHADDDWYAEISRQFADTVFVYSYPGYFTDISPTGYTNGYDWYTLSGGRQDYTNWYVYGRETTIEVSRDFIPPAEDLPKYWEYTRRSLLGYIGQARYGFYGRITDSSTGLPLKARIDLVGHDKDHSWVFSDSLTGIYRRLVLPGTYSLKFSASGYSDHIAEDLTLDVNSGFSFDIALHPGTNDITDSSSMLFQLAFDKQTGVLSLQLFANPKPGANCIVTDIRGRLISRGTLVPLTNGTRQNAYIPLPHLASGVYLVKINFGNLSATKRFVVR